MIRFGAIACVVALGAILLAGCGSAGTAPTLPVTGTVTYKGQPLTGVNVTFTPDQGRPATGTTNAAGKFTLSTFAKGDGAVPGKHKVVITEGVTGDEPLPMPGEPGYKEPQAMMQFPARYSVAETTPLNVEVTPGKTNEFTFDMTDQ